MFKTIFPLIKILSALIILATLSACATSGSSRTIAEKQAAVKEMRQDVLSEIYEKKPDVKSQVASSSGYGVFSNVNVNLLIASVGGGHGIVRNNRSGQETYMNMGEVGLGLGAGLKDFRALLVFHTDESLDYFVNKGWSFGAHADAAAKASDKGGAVGGEVLVNNVSIYQLTKSGLALQATIKGAKFWKNKSLNQYSNTTSQTTTTYPQTTTTYPQAKTYPQTTTTYPQAKTYPQTTTTYPQAKTYPQGTTSYPRATTYPQAKSYPQGATSYPQGETTYPQAKSYPQGETTYPRATTYPQTTTSYPQPTTTYPGGEYIQQQSNQLQNQGNEYLQQNTQIPGSQYIDQGREILQQQGSQVPSVEQIQKNTQFERLGY